MSKNNEQAIENNGKDRSGAGLKITVGAEEDGLTARGALRRTKGVSQRLVRKIAHGEGEGAGALYINGKPGRFKDRINAELLRASLEHVDAFLRSVREASGATSSYNPRGKSQSGGRSLIDHNA